MRVYEIETVIELTEEQHDRLNRLCERMQPINGWSRKDALKFLSVIHDPSFWDAQLDLLENLIEKTESAQRGK